MSNNFNNRNLNLIKNSKNNKKKDNSVFLWATTAILLSIVISFVILIASGSTKVPSIGDIGKKISALMGGVKFSPGLPFVSGRQNILLMGLDSNGAAADPFKGTRSDCLMVLSIDPATKSANVISIPRDSKVYISDNNGVNKINAAHAFGGPDLAIKTVEQNFGIQIDHYIAIDFQGVEELVRLLGGITVYVEKSMHYTDRAGGLYINLHPGYQNLNAENAIGYLRFRHDAISDIGRMRRQQWFVRGLVEKLQSPESIIKIPELIQLASKYIRTDMNFYELSQLAAFGKSINLSDVQTATLPGSPSRFGRISYLILDTQKSQEIIDRLVFRDKQLKKETPLTVSILYSKELTARENEVKELLSTSGYIVTCEGHTKDPHSQIIGHSNYADISSAKLIRDKIPELKSAQFFLSPDNYLCGTSDFTIVLSDTDK